MGKQFTFINARVIDPKVESETTGTLTINDGLFEKRDGSTGCSVRINVSSMSIPPKQTNFNKKPALTNEQLPF